MRGVKNSENATTFDAYYTLLHRVVLEKIISVEKYHQTICCARLLSIVALGAGL